MRKIYLILISSFLIFTNVILFAIPSCYSDSFWVSYSFYMFALLLSCIFTLIIKKEKTNNIGFYYINIILVIISFIAVVIFKFVEKEIIWLPLVLNLGILLIAMLNFLFFKMSDKYIFSVESSIIEKRNFINGIRLELEMIIESNHSFDRNKLIELHRLIQDSDPISVEEVYYLEDKIKNKVSEFKKTLNENLIEEIRLLIVERNKRNKSYKQ